MSAQGSGRDAKRARANSPKQRDLQISIDRVTQFQYEAKAVWENYEDLVNIELCERYAEFMRREGEDTVVYNRWTINFRTFTQANNATGHTRPIRVVRS
jgi:hypothetical protein